MHHNLGKSGLEVSAIGFGCMGLSLPMVPARANKSHSLSKTRELTENSKQLHRYSARKSQQCSASLAAVVLRFGQTIER
jgi:hypothetical protein